MGTSKIDVKKIRNGCACFGFSHRRFLISIYNLEAFQKMEVQFHSFDLCEYFVAQLLVINSLFIKTVLFDGGAKMGSNFKFPNKIYFYFPDYQFVMMILSIGIPVRYLRMLTPCCKLLFLFCLGFKGGMCYFSIFNKNNFKKFHKKSVHVDGRSCICIILMSFQSKNSTKCPISAQ